MRSFGMYDATRGLTLALFAGLGGLAVWGATQVGTYATWRFWVAMAIVAAAGLVLALARHLGTWTKGLRLRLSVGTLVLAAFPVLVCVAWILLASQPGTGWQEPRIDSWSNSLGILGAVHAIGLWRGVLAFGLGVVLGLSVDGVPAQSVEGVASHTLAPAAASGPPVSDGPVAAERRTPEPDGHAERAAGRERAPAG